ncbi:hypothetical protein Y032_0357g3391 [Ancylostoma ceylanicum]|uniref:Uncharacterized protein n=1 Tax=Ancylostoma ceylanicum TaxID=53326 RepID=A0A016RWB0_9BILA|nr:hypothetical protein Y032_0357g3391 [Ancylostoma ceylanicum]
MNGSTESREEEGQQRSANRRGVFGQLPGLTKALSAESSLDKNKNTNNEALTITDQDITSNEASRQHHLATSEEPATSS